MDPKTYTLVNAILGLREQRKKNIKNIPTFIIQKKCNVSTNVYNYKTIKNPLVSKCSIFSFADVWT